MKAPSPLRLLILPTVLLAVLPGCKRNSEARNDPQWWRLEGKRVELAHEVDLLKLRLSNSRQDKGEFAAVAREVSENAAYLEDLKAMAREMRTEVAMLAAKTESDQDNLVRKVRAEATGAEPGILVAADGRSYEGVVITKITDIGIEFRHSEGSARLSAADLTREQHREFGLDPMVAGKALAAEKAKARAYDALLGEQILAANEAKAKAGAAAAERDSDRMLAAARARSEAVKDRLASLELQSQSRLRERPRSVGSTYWGGYTRTRYSYGNRYYGAYSYSSCGSRPSYSVYNKLQCRPVRPLNFSRPKYGAATNSP